MNAPNTSGWKPGAPEAPTGESGIETVTGNRGLMLEEPLIFEIGGADTCGVDFTSPLPLSRGDSFASRGGGRGAGNVRGGDDRPLSQPSPLKGRGL